MNSRSAAYSMNGVFQRYLQATSGFRFNIGDLPITGFRKSLLRVI